MTPEALTLREMAPGIVLYIAICVFMGVMLI